MIELDAQMAVIKMVKGKFEQPKYTIQYGCSGEGFVALAMAEKHVNVINGALIDRHLAQDDTVHTVARLLPLDPSGPVYHVDAPDGTLRLVHENQLAAAAE